MRYSLSCAVPTNKIDMHGAIYGGHGARKALRAERPCQRLCPPYNPCKITPTSVQWIDRLYLLDDLRRDRADLGHELLQILTGHGRELDTLCLQLGHEGLVLRGRVEGAAQRRYALGGRI